MTNLFPPFEPDRKNGRRRFSRLRRIPVRLLVPNMVTLLALCAGLTSMRLAIEHRFELAIAAIAFAAILDMLDGRIARLLKSTSRFGAELDSLADFVNFGVAPALLVWEFTLASSARTGAWIAVLIYASCCCLRLARFNVAHDKLQATGGASPKHFTGVPAPAGALLALFPVFLTFENALDARQAPMLVAGWLLVVGFLMASRLPTFSPKALRIPRGAIIWVMIALPFVVGMMLTRFWLSLILIEGLYLATLLRSTLGVTAQWWRARRAARAAEKG